MAALFGTRSRLMISNSWRRFLRRVKFRCHLGRRSLELPTVSERLSKVDLVQLAKIIQDEGIFDDFFELELTRSRVGFVFTARAVSKLEKINHLFSWRAVRLVNFQWWCIICDIVVIYLQLCVSVCILILWKVIWRSFQKTRHISSSFCRVFLQPS